MNRDIDIAYRKFLGENLTRIKDFDIHPLGDDAAVIEFRFKSMSPPDNALYYQPVRLSKSREYFEETHEVSQSFDYAVIMAIAFKNGNQGYSAAARRLLIDE